MTDMPIPRKESAVRRFSAISPTGIDITKGIRLTPMSEKHLTEWGM